MYDSQMFQRSILSPFLSFLSNDIIEKEIRDGFAKCVRSIIVEPYQVPLLKRLEKELDNGYTRTGMTLGYPFGAQTTKTKIELIKYAIEHEVDEVNLGIDINAVMSGDWEKVRIELAKLLEVASQKVNVIPVSWVIKIPLETVDKLCKTYIDLGITTMKTSAGLHFGDMKVEHVKYLHDHFGNHLEIEVAGRCRTREKAEAMTLAGATSFHISQWRRICGEGYDYQFNYITKQGGYGAYQDRS
jgi:deoxyribose-phosphate aldolase